MTRGRSHRPHQPKEAMPFSDAVVLVAGKSLAGDGITPTAEEIAAHVRRIYPRVHVRNGRFVTHNDITAVRRALSRLIELKQAEIAGERRGAMGRGARVYRFVEP